MSHAVFILRDIVWIEFAVGIVLIARRPTQQAPVLQLRNAESHRVPAGVGYARNFFVAGIAQPGLAVLDGRESEQPLPLDLGKPIHFHNDKDIVNCHGTPAFPASAQACASGRSPWQLAALRRSWPRRLFQYPGMEGPGERRSCPGPPDRPSTARL